MNLRSLRFRLVAWYAGLLMAVFLLLGGVIYGGLKMYLERSLAQTQAQRAQQIAETLLLNFENIGADRVVAEINSWVTPEINNRLVRITRENARLLYVSRNPMDRSFETAEVPMLSTPSPKSSWRIVNLPGNRGLVIASQPCQSRGGEHFVVEVGVPLKPVQEILHRLIILLVCSVAGMMVVAVGGGYLLVKKALAPVDKIAASAADITLHNLSGRLPVAQTGDELERLSLSLNQLIARLENALQHNQRFIADASHELRTPLTIMRGELESIVAETHLAPEAQRTAASVLEEVERLARIVEGLFAVSRLDAGEARKEWVQFDLARLAAGTAEQMCLLAEDKGIAITASAPGEVIVEGDRARMKQVVVNLLDNAIKYTPPGGKVDIAVLVRQGRAVLEVEDTGMGIPAAAQANIFERFFRVDKARSREMGGAGLGLSIVKSICTAHGGRVDFQSTEGAGSRFKVELPLVNIKNEKLELNTTH